MYGICIPVFTGNEEDEHSRIGLWVLTGLFTFLILEKAFPDEDEEEEEEEEEEDKQSLEYDVSSAKP